MNKIWLTLAWPVFLLWFITAARPAEQAGLEECIDIPSIHMKELQAHRLDDPGPQDIIANNIKRRNVTHLVYGWYPYWMGSAYLNLRWDLLSHISFFSLEAASDGSILYDHNWPENWSGLISSAQSAGVTVTITCTLFGTSSINTLIGNSTYRTTLINNLVQACLDGGAEGVNIDFEGSSLNASNLVLFMQQLRTALSASIPGSHLSMATPAVDWTGCFDYDQLAASCDQLIAMCYDYHWSGGSPGPVSPLTPSAVWGSYCMQWTIDDYIYYDTPRNKLATGVPYYGYDWAVTGDPWIYPAADGAGEADPRIYSYIQNNHESYTKYWDTNSMVPWYYYYISGSPRQVWYDNDVSLGLKYDIVLSENIAGIGIWALGYDGTYTELWDQIESHFGSDTTPTPTPSPTITPSPTTTPVMFIVDDADPGCSFTGTHWGISTYGDNYNGSKHYSDTGTGDGDATYTIFLPGGFYQVHAWVNDLAYTTAAQYTIHHSGGTSIITRSQENQGGEWAIDLGTYEFSGTSRVIVNDDAPGIVVADAVRWVPADEPPTPTATPVPAAVPAAGNKAVILLILVFSWFTLIQKSYQKNAG